MRRLTAVAFLALAFATGVAAEEKPLTPAEAIQRVDEKVVVEFPVKATKNRLEQRKEIYLDSEENFRDPKNLGVIITEAGAAKFKDQGIADPAEHFKGKTIRVTGTMTKENDRYRLLVDDPKQIRIVERR
jgi:hypothetical protein